MKIIVESINQAPWHSVTRKDIATVLQHVPADWIGRAHMFLIAAQKMDSTIHDRPVLLNGVIFRIMSRGQSKPAVIKALLELAVRPTRVYPRKFHRFDKEQLRKLEETIQPYYDRIMAQLDAPGNTPPTS